MALVDELVLLAEDGFIYDADPGTEPSTAEQVKAWSLQTARTWQEDAGWEASGHTSLEDLPEFDFDGGDEEVRGTWQAKRLRVVQTEPDVDYVTVIFNQFDPRLLEWYFGKALEKTATKFAKSPGKRVNVERAIQLVIPYSGGNLVIYAPKVSMGRDESLSLQSSEFSTLPIKMTFLDHEAKSPLTWEFVAIP